MFNTEHLNGQIQCVDGDFVCINLHFKNQSMVNCSFIDQIYLNKRTEAAILPVLDFEVDGKHFDTTSLQFEIESIVRQYYECLSKLRLNHPTLL